MEIGQHSKPGHLSSMFFVEPAPAHELGFHCYGRDRFGEARPSHTTLFETDLYHRPWMKEGSTQEAMFVPPAPSLLAC